MTTRNTIKQDILRLAVEYGNACMDEAHAGVIAACAEERAGPVNAAGASRLRRLTEDLPEKIVFEIAVIDRALADACTIAPPVTPKQKRLKGDKS